MSTASRPPKLAPDIGRLLGLSGPGAWAVAALYIVTMVVMAATSDGPAMQTVEGWVALALVVAAAIILVSPLPYPLPLPLTLAVLGVVVFSTEAIIWHTWPTGWPGYAVWNFGADTFLLFMVALRGRLWWGAAGMVLMSALAIHWTLTTSGDWWHGFDLTYRQLATYAAGAFFASWLGRTAKRIAEFQETERRLVAAEQTQEATADERRTQLDRIRRLAGPALEEIARGSTTAAQRRQHGLLEAELRDQIRGRSLALPVLTTAARAARTRGLEVTMLDDLRGEVASGTTDDSTLIADAAAWAASRLGTIVEGSATIRLARIDGRPVVTVATADGGVAQFTPAASPNAPAHAARG
ncbi:MAG: hypothetical protein ABIR17_12460 [Pseudolysinimonas sp.]|uniref:hypothetical protein n=1 Tax=Pseudolysinimonas sp. TaxID=2680009 RepID=UPI003266C051